MFSFGIIAESFSVFDCKVCEWNVRVSGILLVTSLCDIYIAVSRSISWVQCLPGVTADSG